MAKKVLIAFFVVLTGMSVQARGFDFNFPLPGNSIANNALQYNVLKKVYFNSTKEYPLCSDFKVTDTQLIQEPYDVVKKNDKYIKGYWKEIWTFDACEQKFQVPLTFYINKSGTDFIIEK